MQPDQEVGYQLLPVHLVYFLFGAKIFLSFCLNNLIVFYDSVHIWVSLARRLCHREL